MVMVRRELKILDETGLPEKNWNMNLRQKRSWQDLKKKVVCKTPKQVRGQKLYAYPETPIVNII